MNMREYRPEDLEIVMDIANQAWKPIRQMSREALGDKMIACIEAKRAALGI